MTNNLSRPLVLRLSTLTVDSTFFSLVHIFTAYATLNVKSKGFKIQNKIRHDLKYIFMMH